MTNLFPICFAIQIYYKKSMTMPAAPTATSRYKIVINDHTDDSRTWSTVLKGIKQLLLKLAPIFVDVTGFKTSESVRSHKYYTSLDLLHLIRKEKPLMTSENKTYFVRNPAVPYWMNTSVVFGCISLANAYTTRRLLGGIVMFDFIYKATQIQSLVIYELDFYIPAPIQVCNRE